MHSHEHAPPFARTFTKLRVQHNEPRAGFDMYIAVWREAADKPEIVIGAVSVDLLAERWQRITGLQLKRERAQHVIVTYFAAPEELWSQAKAALEGERSEEPDARPDRT